MAGVVDHLVAGDVAGPAGEGLPRDIPGRSQDILQHHVLPLHAEGGGKRLEEGKAQTGVYNKVILDTLYLVY